MCDHHVDVAAKFDVGAAACHVGGDGDGTGRAGLRHDGGFLFMEAGVQHVVFNALRFQNAGQGFGFFDGCGAHQNRLAALARFLDGIGNGVEFFGLGAIDFVVFILAGHGHVGREFP